MMNGRNAVFYVFLEYRGVKLCSLFISGYRKHISHTSIPCYGNIGLNLWKVYKDMFSR
jgi:hypothetical protein